MKNNDGLSLLISVSLSVCLCLCLSLSLSSVLLFFFYSFIDSFFHPSFLYILRSFFPFYISFFIFIFTYFLSALFLNTFLIQFLIYFFYNLLNLFQFHHIYFIYFLLLFSLPSYFLVFPPFFSFFFFFYPIFLLEAMCVYYNVVRKEFVFLKIWMLKLNPKQRHPYPNISNYIAPCGRRVAVRRTAIIYSTRTNKIKIETTWEMYVVIRVGDRNSLWVVTRTLHNISFLFIYLVLLCIVFYLLFFYFNVKMRALNKKYKTWPF